MHEIRRVPGGNFGRIVEHYIDDNTGHGTTALEMMTGRMAGLTIEFFDYEITRTSLLELMAEMAVD